MADADGLDRDQNLALARFGDVDGLNAERASGLVQHGCDRFHHPSPFAFF
jgi:hypothetical protein